MAEVDVDGPVHWEAAGALQERRVAMLLVWETWPEKTLNLSHYSYPTSFRIKAAVFSTKYLFL